MIEQEQSGVYIDPEDWFSVLAVLVGGSVLAVLLFMAILYLIVLLNGVAP